MRNHLFLHSLQSNVVKSASAERSTSAAFRELGEMDKQAATQGRGGFFQNIGNAIKPGFNNLWNSGRRAVNGLGGAINTMNRNAMTGLRQLGNWGQQAKQRTVQGLQVADRGLQQGVDNAWNAGGQAIKNYENRMAAMGGATHDGLAAAGSKINQYKQNLQAVGQEAGEAYQNIRQGMDQNAQRHNQFASGGVNAGSLVAPTRNYQSQSQQLAAAPSFPRSTPQGPSQGGYMGAPALPAAPAIPRAVPVNEQTLQPIQNYPYGKSAFVLLGDLDKSASKVQAGKKLLQEGVAKAKGLFGQGVEKGKGMVDTAGKKVTDLAAANPRTAKGLKIGGGTAAAGGALYGSNRMGHSSGMEQGKEVGWDAGLQHGIAGAQQGGPNSFLERLMALFGGGQVDPQEIFNAANSNREKVLSQLTYKG